jgi:hypothetical protein
MNRIFRVIPLPVFSLKASRPPLLRGLFVAALILGAAWPGGGTLAAPETEALVGVWSGGFTIGPDDSWELIFTFAQGGDGLEATLDIPRQNSAGIKADSVQLKGNELLIEFQALRAEYSGTLRWSADGSRVERVRGDWNQVGEQVPLTLRTADIAQNID